MVWWLDQGDGGYGERRNIGILEKRMSGKEAHGRTRTSMVELAGGKIVWTSFYEMLTLTRRHHPRNQY